MTTNKPVTLIALVALMGCGSSPAATVSSDAGADASPPRMHEAVTPPPESPSMTQRDGGSPLEEAPVDATWRAVSIARRGGFAQGAVSAGGDAVAIWSGPWTGDTRLFAARYRIATGWSEPTPLSQYFGAIADVGIDDHGNAFATWMEEDINGTSHGIWVARAPRDEAWAPAEQIDESAPAHPQLSVGPAGQALIAWKRNPQSFPRHDEVRSTFYDHGEWTTPEFIAVAGSPRLSDMDSQGRTTIVYADDIANHSRQYTPDSGWSESDPFVLDLSADWVEQLALAVGRNGERCIVSHLVGPRLGEHRLWATHHDGTGWPESTLVSPAIHLRGSDMHAVIDGIGDTLIVRGGSDENRSEISIYRHTPGTGWHSPHRLTEDSPVSVELAANSTGRAIVLWRWWADSTLPNSAATYHPSTGWSEGTTLTPTLGGRDASCTLAGMDDSGHALALCDDPTLGVFALTTRPPRVQD